ncbi:MAG: 30S ribosomal protein S16 [Candidatus Dojkabacteria bacterium]|uniref:Small ribosomal subunit protein bS16 n=2 Tax=Candidatus Dojkabacteria TaxID=74243 RepID=A0A136KF05_9BACT|nr:MAG: 30S ribosomal protein S16 [candidate division WS6 bacterium OLB21]MBW7953179.1 30S ribosomal protein S16 [Candidatus Dojkabacteria bacterium]WKZ28326.1 MAG: 30S ribosomal protein S16 [Candidatus Dojkabacteria bacterium]
MVKLRLTRTGKKHAPSYRVVAIQARTKREGMALEVLGHYNPRSNPSVIEIDAERVKFWLNQGAQPSDTVKNLLVKKGIIEASKEKKQFTKQPGTKNAERKAKKSK